ncbi:MAG: CRISPR system precrRNA processing endoribonuclease RAMP protein Cas6 [Chloroflexi bacterium]|nr:CRISPR system precrRNA processing endoribonuclease RAMP protein Cas6 [Chloroflexota bacterium]
MNLQAHVLQFSCKAETDMVTPPYKGSMLRGALFGALRRDFCLDQRGSACADSRLRQACPVCALLATADEESARGVEVARPCTVEPPLEDRTLYRTGDAFSFGVTLFGEARPLLPYIVLGVRRMGEGGIGNRGRAAGRFAVARISAQVPVSGESEGIYEAGERVVRQPGLAVTHAGVLAACERLGSPPAVTVALLTPLRLIVEKRLVKRLTFPLLMRRVLRRLTDLSETATGTRPDFDHQELLQQAEAVQVADDRTRWVDVPSYSSRQGRFTPIGGLVGEITFRGDLRPFLPWLLWSEVTHIGKDCTKGDGWVRLRWPS